LKSFCLCKKSEAFIKSYFYNPFFLFLGHFNPRMLCLMISCLFFFRGVVNSIRSFTDFKPNRNFLRFFQVFQIFMVEKPIIKIEKLLAICKQWTKIYHKISFFCFFTLPILSFKKEVRFACGSNFSTSKLFQLTSINKLTFYQPLRFRKRMFEKWYAI
jgi:hypothetical protein